jgi:methanogenic corrinoid protein MtbC1
MLSEQRTLASAIAARQLASDSELPTRHGAATEQHCTEQAFIHLTHLAHAIEAESPRQFIDYVHWARILRSARGVPVHELITGLRAMDEALAQRFPDDYAKQAAALLRAALQTISEPSEKAASFIDPSRPFGQLALDYLDALLAGDRKRASRLILDSADSGTSVRDIYEHVFELTQYEIGRLWQLNEVSIAQEHFCTAATQLVMSQLYPRLFSGPRNGRTILATCVPGDVHELGIRMISDFFELDGWDSHYLGANVPLEEVVQTARARKPDLVALSATLNSGVAAVRATIAGLRTLAPEIRIKVLVGGRPFRVEPELWKRVGADGFAATAREAVERGNELTASIGGSQ